MPLHQNTTFFQLQSFVYPSSHPHHRAGSKDNCWKKTKGYEPRPTLAFVQYVLNKCGLLQSGRQKKLRVELLGPTLASAACSLAEVLHWVLQQHAGPE